jgi:hypothetical protein
MYCILLYIVFCSHDVIITKQNTFIFFGMPCFLSFSLNNYNCSEHQSRNVFKGVCMWNECYSSLLCGISSLLSYHFCGHVWTISEWRTSFLFLSLCLSSIHISAAFFPLYFSPTCYRSSLPPAAPCVCSVWTSVSRPPVLWAWGPRLLWKTL